MKSVATALLLIFTVAGPAQAEEHSLEQLVIEMASTAAEHNAVSHHYSAQAETARADARRHEQLARTYAGGGRAAQPQMQRHCEQLAKKFDEIAAEYDELARLHGEEARKSAK
jgi:hypothetical protein